MSQKATAPVVLYKIPHPDQATTPSELYLLKGVVLDTATDPIKRWVLHEEHGYWDEPQKKFKIQVTTFLPNKTCSCVSLSDVYEQIEKQVTERVRSGFKYQMEWNPYEPPFFKKFELQPDGTKKQYR